MRDIEIIYDDSFFTLCVKPPDVLSQQDNKGSLNMPELLEEQLKTPYKAVHRLDYGVGGIMVYAKNDICASNLSEQIRNHTFEKEYLAVVCGTPAEKEGVLQDLLFKDSTKNKTFVVDKLRKGVKKASLEYKVLDTKETEKGILSLVWIKLHTGRTHQIRVQFSSRQLSLYGDGKYGNKNNSKFIALWSHKLTFKHPKTKGEVCYSSFPEACFPWNIFKM